MYDMFARAALCGTWTRGADPSYIAREIAAVLW